MGSLLPGWATKSSTEDEALKRSNSSMTTEEVQKFWKVKQQQMEEHLAEASKDYATSPNSKTKVVQAIAEDIQEQQQEALAAGAPLPSPNSAWWTRSNWAFLNDPPEVVQNKQTNYVPQFDVALKGQMAQDHIGRTSSNF